MSRKKGESQCRCPLVCSAILFANYFPGLYLLLFFVVPILVGSSNIFVLFVFQTINIQLIFHSFRFHFVYNITKRAIW